MQDPETIRVPSADVCAAFAQWLKRMGATGVRLVALEGMLDSGKTHLIQQQPFAVEADRFLCLPVSRDTPYREAIDHQAMRNAIMRALDVFPLVVVEGAMLWPLLLPLPVERLRVRRVYLKRMMHLQPDVWCDDNAIQCQDLWPPSAFTRSIVRYHHDMRPWLVADLVVERIEPAP